MHAHDRALAPQNWMNLIQASDIYDFIRFSIQACLVHYYQNLNLLTPEMYGLDLASQTVQSVCIHRWTIQESLVKIEPE